MSRPRFSIIIALYGKRAVTERCLETLDEAFGERLGGEVELVLVDNASPDDTRELLRSWKDRATVVLLDENRNFSGGNNAGADAARGEVLVLLNNDTEVPAGALEQLVEEASRPGVGIAGCRLLYPDGTIQHAGCAWWRGPDQNVRTFHLFRHEAGDLPAACATFDCDTLTGACLAIRRDLFLELGGLDETFVNGWEDADLCVKARIAGQRVVYRGDVAVVHAEGQSRGRAPDESANERVFFNRYAHMVQEDSERLAAQFDATGPHLGLAVHPANLPGASAVSVEGEVCGLAGESAESRALLASLETAQLSPATREWQPTNVLPRLTEAEWGPVLRGRARPLSRGALRVQAPVGRLGAAEVHPGAVLRLATVPEYDVSAAAALWAATPALAEDLIAAGADPERVEALLPIIPGVPLGPGGRGVLAELPAHDEARCAELLLALAELPSTVSIRLLPTIATEPVVALAAELLPRAGVLAPVASESRFAALAGECDVVVCVDSREPFERRPLLAAAAGATVVHLPDGPAADVLGGELCFDGSPVALQAAVAKSATGSRADTAERVRSSCCLSVLGARLVEMVARAQQQAAGAGRALILA